MKRMQIPVFFRPSLWFQGSLFPDSNWIGQDARIAETGESCNLSDAHAGNRFKGILSFSIVRGGEQRMTSNANSDGLVVKRFYKPVRTVAVKREFEAGAFQAAPTNPRRMYTAQVNVIDPDGHETLNLTKLTFEEDLYGKRLANPDIREVLASLVDAAGEWSA
jgi:hypothetical protein